jgi:hypothetical protein
VQLTEKQIKWVHNGCIIVILVDVFSGFADRHNFIGSGIAVAAAAVVMCLMFSVKKQKEPEVAEQENEHYLTVRELIDRLELIGDKTNVVVDSNGLPILSISSMYDEDFGCATWLRGAPGARQMYRDARGGLKWKK